MFKNNFYKHIRKYSGFRKSAYISATLLSLITLALLCPIYLVPDSIEATSKPAQPASLNYSATSSTASVAFDVSSTSGTFTSSSTSGTNAEFSISTDNATGYVLTLRTSGSDTTLKDTTNSSNTISNITSTSGITASNFAVNTWGILPSKYNSTANTGNNPNYYKIDSTGFTMDETSSANSVANTYTVGLGLKVDFTKSAGTYTNTTVIAEYVAKPITYAIYYYTNTQDTVTGMPTINPQIPQNPFPGTTSTTVNLASAPSRTGYTFLGWCMGTSSSSNITVGTNGAADTCGNSSTNQFNAGQSFGIDAADPNAYFYAMWQANTYTVTISNTNTTSSVASLTIPYGGSATVTVTPDSGFYLSTVSCPSGIACTGYNTGVNYTNTQTITVTISSANNTTITFIGREMPIPFQNAVSTDCGKDMYDNRGSNAYKSIIYSTAEINSLCWMTRNLDLPGGTSLNSSNTNLIGSITSYTLPASTTTGSSDASVAKVYNSNKTTCGASPGCYSYYSYAAATVGRNPSSGRATSDICPKGWRLPTSAEYSNLKNSYTTGSAMTSAPFMGVYGAFYDTNGYNSIGNNYGIYWSSTALNSTRADYLQFTSTGGTIYIASKSSRLAIRCVMKAASVPDSTVTVSNSNTTSSVTNLTIPYGSYTTINVTPNSGYYLASVTCPNGYTCTGYNTGVSYTGTQTITIWNEIGENATISFKGKEPPIPFQTTSFTDCGKDMYDNRGTSAYKSIIYSTALINGQCWMTRNLDLPGGTVLNSSDSNLNGSITSYTLPASTTAGSSDSSVAKLYNSNSTNCGASPGCYSYYSYAAATVGLNPSSGSATSDICPKGWRLPTSTEYSNLKSSYSTGAAMTASPFLGVYGAYYTDNGYGSLGNNYGLYWSSTATGATSASYLQYSSGGGTIYIPNKTARLAIRCVKYKDYMQDATATSLASLMPNSGDSVTLYDKRDEQAYTIAKIGGKYWMTKNLDLAGGTTLTSADSNVTTSYTLPASSTAGFTSNDTAYVYNSGSTSCSSGNPCYSYYSHVAAAAGTNPSTGEVEADICPKGWRLPTQAEYSTLRSSYSTGATLTASPFNGVYAGWYDYSEPDSIGTDAMYWSSTAYYNTAYYLYYGNSTSDIDHGVGKAYGAAVRCVANV